MVAEFASESESGRALKEILASTLREGSAGRRKRRTRTRRGTRRRRTMRTRRRRRKKMRTGRGRTGKRRLACAYRENTGRRCH